jgi:hypothetical protein
VNAPQRPYRAYSSRPVRPEERDGIEILFGGLYRRAEKLIQAVFENLGYRARPLPNATRDDLLLGRELADTGQCCLTSFTTGNLARFLGTEAKRIGPDKVSQKYVYLTAGACDTCRFGQYHRSYELALRNVGLEAFRLFLMERYSHGFDLRNAPSLYDEKSAEAAVLFSRRWRKGDGEIHLRRLRQTSKRHSRTSPSRIPLSIK